jgi:hypothetical protein
MKWKIPTKHHSGKVRCRLRRPEDWHELEGRAERECGGAHCGGEARTGATRKLMPVRRPLGKGSDRREAGICARITVGTLHGVDFRNRDEKKKRTDSAGVGVSTQNKSPQVHGWAHCHPHAGADASPRPWVERPERACEREGLEPMAGRARLARQRDRRSARRAGLHGEGSGWRPRRRGEVQRAAEGRPED